MPYFGRKIVVEIVSADINNLLNILIRDGIVLEDLEFVDQLRVKFTVSTANYSRICKKKRDIDQINVLKRMGLLWRVQAMRHHPILIITAAFIILASMYLPSRILHIDVGGNSTVEKSYILEQAAACGIRFGASRKTLRSEQVKNKLLELIPQLEWAAFTTNGCSATIQVTEKQPQEPVDSPQVGSIVAARDGIIQKITVTQGTALCKAGDLVMAGQTLVSGYTDCGIYIQANRAQAEISGQTLRQIEARSIHPVWKRGEEGGVQVNYSLQIGKKLIKFYKDSGISDITCVKIRAINCVQLPGGFPLPLQIIKETCTQAERVSNEAHAGCDWLGQKASEYLTDQMIAGRILKEHTKLLSREDSCSLQGTFSCVEEIGAIKNEEILRSDAESD